MKQIVFFPKMHSNQEKAKYGNECSRARNQIFWVGIGALDSHLTFCEGLAKTNQCFGVYPPKPLH